MFQIIVASTNPVKLSAAKAGFSAVFPDETYHFLGVSVDSGVSHQPIGEAETVLGATNRMQAGARQHKDAAFWVGIEGGVKETDLGWEAFAWVVIRSQKGVVGRGRTGSFFLPQAVADVLRQGVELGVADDQVFGQTNSKHGQGAVGLLTHGVLTRTTYYQTAVVLALIPFVHPRWYQPQSA